MSSINITTKGDGSASVLLDGREISHLIATDGLSIPGWEQNRPVVVDVRLAVTQMACYLADADVVLDEDTRALLVKLGWAQPR